jgi:LysM repeat protein
MKKFLIFILLIPLSLFGQDTIKHVVKQGETLYKIANIYEVQINDIYLLNPGVGDMINIGQIINVKIIDIIVMDTIQHVVKAGETLTKISNLYDVKIDTIYKYNPDIAGDMIYIGQIILIIKEHTIESAEMTKEEKINCVIETMQSQIGIIERTGNNDGVEVEAYLASAGLGRGNPWCASFVNWTYMQCGYDFNLDAPGWVPSWFPNSKLIYTRAGINKAPPQPGDLIGIWYESKGRLAHIGFYEDQSGDWIISIEGNTNEGGSREGDGVYRKIRMKRTIHSISSWIY